MDHKHAFDNHLATNSNICKVCVPDPDKSYDQLRLMDESASFGNIFCMMKGKRTWQRKNLYILSHS